METSAPAKIILFGEHAVVYGQPAIAAPVTSIRARMKIKPAPQGTGIKVDSPLTRQTLLLSKILPTIPEDESSLIFALNLALQKLGVAVPDMELELQSDIPLGRGLGSGAAVSAALLRALYSYLGMEVDAETLNSLVYEVEKRHHGTPSGIDNTVIVYEKPVYFVRNQPMAFIQIQNPFSLLIGDTGYGTPTHITVGEVRQQYEAKPERVTPILERIGEITREARRAIENGNISVLGRLMNENHDLLQRLAVSSVELDFLCEIALHAGAWGAKMSGGGRGGNMIALVSDSQAEQVMNALYSGGAQRVIKTRIRPMDTPE